MHKGEALPACLDYRRGDGDESDGKDTPEKAVKILKKRGLEVNLEQAGLILDFLYKMADIAMAQCFKLPP